MPDDQRGQDINLPKETEFDRLAALAREYDTLAAQAREAKEEPPAPAPPPQRGLLADFFLGAGKGVGRAVNSANASLASMGPQQQINPAILDAMKQSGVDPATLPGQVEARLTPENLTQQVGSFAPDVAAAFAMPGVRSGQALRAGANIAQRSAQAAMGRGGSLVDDIVAGTAGGYLGGENVAAAIIALRLLNRPHVKSAVARGVSAAAPVLQPAAAGVASGAARQLSGAERRAAILQQLLGGGTPGR